MQDDRFLSLQEMAMNEWKDHFSNLFTLPFKAAFAISNWIKRLCYEAFYLLFFYLAKDTVYDIESDVHQ